MGGVRSLVEALEMEALAQPAKVKEDFPEKATHRLDPKDKKGIPQAEDSEGCSS